jgi:large conductance mechanosensitive channel
MGKKQFRESITDGVAAVKKRGHHFFRDFKMFINRGNALQLAIAFVMGVAFNAIVTSLVGDIIMQFFSLAFGKGHIDELVWWINETPIYYGRFIFSIFNFLLITFSLYVIIRIVLFCSQSKDNKLLLKPDTTESLLREIREILKKFPQNPTTSGDIPPQDTVPPPA